MPETAHAFFLQLLFPTFLINAPSSPHTFHTAACKLEDLLGP
jgi:hypothetical protein